MKGFIHGALSLVALSLPFTISSAAEIHWSYEGDTGPEYWATLDPSFEVCGTGVEQSPVDIRNDKDFNLDALQIDYRETPLEVVNNGHTIQVNVEPGQGTLTIGTNVYSLKQFHFHTPSEHKKSGRLAPMELHFVNVNAEGEIAVIGVFLKERKANTTLQTIFEFAPLVEGEQLVPEVHVNINTLLPKDTREFYHYQGSLTTPPCSEGVKWFVMGDPLYVSKEQIQFFESIFHANARPVQPINDRIIYEAED